MASVADALKQVTDPNVAKELKASWADMVSDKKKCGTELMLTLYESHPETKAYFKRLGDVSPSEAWNNRKLSGHAITLMYGVQSFIEQLDEPDLLEDIGRKLAVNHLNRGVGSSQLKLVEGPLITLLENKLGSKCTAKTKESWGKLLAFILAVLDDEKSSQ